jgi:hypothetical protein
MIKAHVAGLTGLRLTGFLDGEEVPRVARITRRDAESRPLRLQLPDLGFRLEADLMTPATAFHPFGQRHRKPVRGRHSLHRRPRLCVLAPLELLDLRVMTRGARLRRRNARFCDILGRRVFLTMADSAINPVLAVRAQLPIRDDIGRDLLVALNTAHPLSSASGPEMFTGRMAKFSRDRDHSEHETDPEEISPSHSVLLHPHVFHTAPR